MLPVGLMMKEHRLIEKMVKLMDNELERLSKDNKPDLCFIDAAVDFIKIYADKCHHGKEEDILFSELKKKSISKEHEKTMNELISEHVYGRKTVGALLEARQKYEAGDENQIENIKENIKKLIDFYPKHIEKEDKRFFLPVMEYFTDEEKDKMLAQCRDFDMKMIHEKYKAVVENLKSAS
jgi:hemerythrin-like domain-containing protein